MQLPSALELSRQLVKMQNPEPNSRTAIAKNSRGGDQEPGFQETPHCPRGPMGAEQEGGPVLIGWNRGIPEQARE